MTVPPRAWPGGIMVVPSVHLSRMRQVCRTPAGQPGHTAPPAPALEAASSILRTTSVLSSSCSLAQDPPRGGNSERAVGCSLAREGASQSCRPIRLLLPTPRAPSPARPPTDSSFNPLTTRRHGWSRRAVAGRNATGPASSGRPLLTTTNIARKWAGSALGSVEKRPQTVRRRPDCRSLPLAAGPPP